MRLDQRRVEPTMISQQGGDRRTSNSQEMRADREV
jgi:hypothetical protein